MKCELLRPLPRPVHAGLLLALLLSGCAGSSYVPVAGRITRGGQAVPNTYVCFERAPGDQSWATTNALGEFRLVSPGNRQGVPPGKYRVWLSLHSAEPGPHDTPADLAKMADLKQALEAKYGREHSVLEVTIDGPQEQLNLACD